MTNSTLNNWVPTHLCVICGYEETGVCDITTDLHCESCCEDNECKEWEGE